MSLILCSPLWASRMLYLYGMTMIIWTYGLISDVREAHDGGIYIIYHREIISSIFLWGILLTIISERASLRRYFLARLGYSVIPFSFLIFFIYSFIWPIVGYKSPRLLSVNVDVAIPILLAAYTLIFPWIGLSPLLSRTLGRVLFWCSFVLVVVMPVIMTIIMWSHDMSNWYSQCYFIATSLFFLSLWFRIDLIKSKVCKQVLSRSIYYLSRFTTFLFLIVLIMFCLSRVLIIGRCVYYSDGTHAWSDQMYAIILLLVFILGLVSMIVSRFEILRYAINGFCIASIPLGISLIVAFILILIPGCLYDVELLLFLLNIPVSFIYACYIFPFLGLSLGVFCMMVKRRG